MRRRVITVFNQWKVHGSTGLPSPLRIHNLPKVDAQRAESTRTVRLCTVLYCTVLHIRSPMYRTTPMIRSHWPILFVRVCQCACHTPFRISNLDSLYSGVVSNRQRRVPSVRAVEYNGAICIPGIVYRSSNARQKSTTRVSQHGCQDRRITFNLTSDEPNAQSPSARSMQLQ